MRVCIVSSEHGSYRDVEDGLGGVLGGPLKFVDPATSLRLGFCASHLALPPVVFCFMEKS